jgi:pimeloyl-ACP methyl ester carboxylesterase
VEEAAMMARHGYGVLLLDPRGQGGSEGDTVRWQGDRDLIAGAKYLQSRPDVDDARIAGFGSSVGGEQLLEAAAQSTAFRAVVSEGAGERVGEMDASGFEQVTATPLMAIMTGAVTIFGNDAPPPPIVDRIGKIAPRPVFLIYAEPGMGGEDYRQPQYFAAAGEPKQMWKVPGSGHTGGIEAQPAEFERRVIEFLDRSLGTS